MDILGKTRDCEVVALWNGTLVNHLHWCATSTQDGNGDMMVAKWLSCANHVMNEHTNHDAVYDECALYKNCSHREYTEEEQRLWIDPGGL